MKRKYNSAQLTKQESLDLMREIEWKNDFKHFVNALSLNYFDEHQIVQIISKYDLMILERDQWDKRVHRTVRKMNIPPRGKFLEVLDYVGVAREYFFVDDVMLPYPELKHLYEYAQVWVKYPNRVLMQRGDYAVSWEEAKQMAKETYGRKREDGEY